MRIGIIGSRGIPNNYGGFEQFAEYLSVGLVKNGFEVYVYCPHDHPYQNPSYSGVHLIHCFDPESFLGTSGQFIYDFNCIMDCRKRSFDLIYQLGYTSSAIWQQLLPSKVILVTNMDGLEWQRNKYNAWVRKFLLYSEKKVIKSSHFLIADSTVIKDYLFKIYHVNAHYISYGAMRFSTPDIQEINKFNLKPFEYYLVIARLQHDNKTEEIIQAVLNSRSDFPLIIVGDPSNKFGKYLVKKYASSKIRFLGSIFDKTQLNQLRYHAALYFHGHSGGGTNPSLLEAMAASARICAHKNPFNESILTEDALYFENIASLTQIIDFDLSKSFWDQKTIHNIARIENYYNWELIIEQYVQFFNRIILKKIEIKQ
jgi:glycosyltransferase involved in cell wall biosynthesis